MTRMSVREDHLMIPVGNLWRDRGARLAYEVPLHSRFVDMVALEESATLVAIELKVRDWRTALRQAVVAQIAADETYIAIWHTYAHRVDRALLVATRVGLVVVEDRTAKVVLSAQPSKITIPDYRDVIVDSIKPYRRTRPVVQPTGVHGGGGKRNSPLPSLRTR